MTRKKHVSTWKPSGTVTGRMTHEHPIVENLVFREGELARRLSGLGPNLQQIPHNSPEYNQIRKAFVEKLPDASVDYKTIEKRMKEMFPEVVLPDMGEMHRRAKAEAADLMTAIEVMRRWVRNRNKRGIPTTETHRVHHLNKIAPKMKEFNRQVVLRNFR